MSYQDNDDQCNKCGEKYESKYGSKYKWCKSCQINNLKKNFINWTSDNERIDNLIQEMQLEINELDDVIFEWIPFDQFNNIKEIGEEGLDKVYSAIWKDRPLNYDGYKNEYTRNQLNKKGKKYPISYIGEVLRMYGISQYPNTIDYIIVFQEIYCKKCGKKYTNIIKEWCESCQIIYFKENLVSSGNEKIDNLIQVMQSGVNYESARVLEWIPYDQLSDIHKISEDDIDILYSATWKNGPLCYYDGEWTRKSNKGTILKYLYNSPNIINLLNKITSFDCNNIYGCNKQYKIGFNTNYEWCKLCQINNLRQNFTNWSSGNEKIDSLIQEIQLEINESYDIIFEWISYNKFNNIKEKIFIKEYSAIWKDGPLNYDKIKNKYTRNKQDIKVTLKLYSFQNITNEFLNKFKEDLNKYHGKIFGISQNPYTKDFIIVLQDEYNGKCNKCDEEYISGYFSWCRLCHINYLEKFFINRTSGNKKIDNFIQNKRSKISFMNDTTVEFIPYNHFNNIKEINKNSYVSQYSAIWKNGPLYNYNKKWIRKSYKKVYLVLYYLQNTDEFLNKVKKYLSSNDNPIYGISQSQDTKYYIIVFQYKLYCARCGEEYMEYYIKIKYEWCKKCESDNLKLNFTNWTSKNNEIDYLIQKMQLLKISSFDTGFEWIPYKQFSNIKKINDDDFTKMYSAIWKNDFYYSEYFYEKEHIKKLKSKVVLKYSQNITYEVEHSSHETYGISQDPITKAYIMVIKNKYCEKCNEEYTDTFNKWCK
ncbi:unnamed protein product [Rhizophagus irregularis]|nr:unnamed protein product [Rhizophagus irregularis]